MQILTDNPIRSISEDRFDFKDYAQILANIIIETEKLPFVIGIFGEWGTGKTSMMWMIHDILKDRSDLRSVWFNPWKYDNKEELWHALIQTILLSILEDDKAKRNRKLAKLISKLGKECTWVIFKKVVSSATSGLISDGTIEGAKNKLFEQDTMYHRHINHFEEDFPKIIKEYLGNQGKLLVFVDDLDRCIPENAITVLESLKLFLGNAQCVFILGMDRQIVELGIKQRYGDLIEMSGRDYLDKIIQVPFFLPPVRFKNLRKELQNEMTAEYTDEIWRIVQIGLKGNPRNTKRFINCFYLSSKIVEKKNLYS